MRVSVAICTWNRAELLDKTLAEFLGINVPNGVMWELLVVNNNCTDSTDNVIASYADRLPIRRLFESEPGLSNARNRAVEAATGDLILWTDDDVLVDKDWIYEFVRATSLYPEAAYFGGTIEPWFAAPPPRWIKRHFEQISTAFAVKTLGESIRPITENDPPFGANMAFVTRILKQYSFDPRLGSCENHKVGCDETDVIGRIRSNGHQGVWVGSARVRHYIPANRLTLFYLWTVYKANGQAEARMSPPPEPCTLLWGAPRWMVRNFLGEFVEFLARYPTKSEKWIKCLQRTAHLSGKLAEARAARKMS